MTNVCDRVLPLTLAHESFPRWLSLEDGGPELVRAPVIAVLVHGPGGWALLDTGFSPALRNPVLAGQVYRSRPPELPGDGHPLLDALAAHGLAPDDLSLVALSHLHLDHTGGLEVVPDGTPVAVQRAELAFGRSPEADAAFRREDYERPGIAWRELDGDAPLTPGVDAISTPGHTPGHSSFLVRGREGAWLFAMDAIDLQEGIDRDVAIGTSARPADAGLRRTSHDRLVALAAAEGAHLVPGHCPVSWPPSSLPA